LLLAAFLLPGLCPSASGQAVETLDLYQAVQQGRVKAEITGSGIDTVSLKVSRPKNSKPLRLRVPIGTMFVTGSGSAQNMVGTSAQLVDLSAVITSELSVPAACVNLHLSVPGEEDKFSVAPAPEQEELQKVLPVLHAAGSDEEVIQAAVWIITDDADYDDLGTLVVSYGGLGFGGSRAINEPQAARAMMLLEKAKLDVKQRAVWGDRVSICEEVAGTQANAAGWCSAVLRDTTTLEWKLASLDHKKRAVREAARNGLAKENLPDSLPRLIEALPKFSAEAAASVVRALGNYAAPEAADAVAAAMAINDRPVQLAAAEILSKSDDPVRREAALALLAKLRPPAKPAAAKPAAKPAGSAPARK
jgi:hypothetical protein